MGPIISLRKRLLTLTETFMRIALSYRQASESPHTPRGVWDPSGLSCCICIYEIIIGVWSAQHLIRHKQLKQFDVFSLILINTYYKVNIMFYYTIDVIKSGYTIFCNRILSSLLSSPIKSEETYLIVLNYQWKNHI